MRRVNSQVSQRLPGHSIPPRHNATIPFSLPSLATRRHVSTSCTAGDAEDVPPWVKRLMKEEKHAQGTGCGSCCGGNAATTNNTVADLTNTTPKYVTLHDEDKSFVDVRAWIRGVPVDETACEQMISLTSLLDVVKHPVAIMPDVHGGKGSTIGSVIPTTNAIIPACVGVDLGCGMMAVKTSLQAEDLPDNLSNLRLEIEQSIPHGRTNNGKAASDRGGWRGVIPPHVIKKWDTTTDLAQRFDKICYKRPDFEKSNNINHFGTLGTGNHFIEVCLDENKAVWAMLHSGSRGIGNRIGTHFIDLAIKDMGQQISALPNKNLAYLREGTDHFRDYVEAVSWAQDFAKHSRELMMSMVLDAMRRPESGIKKPFTTEAHAINCHHNYVEQQEVIIGYDQENGVDEEEMVWITRKGATSARKGQLAIIPGSMGARSYIVRGKGNPKSYYSCSHGAGRKFGRNEACRRFSVEEHVAATAGVECRNDKTTLDETPMAYKDIDAVMEAQSDLVEIVATLRQVLCVKG